MKTQHPVTQGLAIVGFITLLFLGIALAVYAARFVPTAVNGIAGAVITITDAFVPAEDDSVIVIDDSPSDDQSGDNDVFPTSPDEETTDEETPVDETPTTPTPTPGDEEVDIISGPGTPTGGLADLTVEIVATGLLVGGSNADNFVPATNLSDDDRIGFKFVIENRGGRATGDDWGFTVVMPTEETYIFESSSSHVRSLNPGDRIEYVMGFDDGNVGNNRQITVSVDGDNDVRESNENNNADFVRIDINK